MDHWETKTFDFLHHEKDVSLTPDVIFKETKQLLVRRNLVYVGAGVIFRQNGDKLEILLIQEARDDCKYSWYLPAGRVEPGETLEEGMMREVEEETGLSCKIRGLICVQLKPTTHYLWARFAFLADATGGSLKVEPDEESLGASWFDVEDVLHCEEGLWSKNGQCNITQIAAGYQMHYNRFELLLRTVGCQVKLPIIEFSIDCHIRNIIFSLLNEVFDVDQVSLNEINVISVECSPKPVGRNDGFCLTLLCDLTKRIGNDDRLNVSFNGRNAGYSIEDVNSQDFISRIESWTQFGCKI